jgi:tripartite-type tricarboxylate transporter receptor subunit TctC
LTARLLAEKLNATLGSIVVENRAGATGKVGAEAVSRADPDGYSILYTVGGDLTVWQTKNDVPDRIRNLTPITSAVSTITVIAVRPTLAANSIAELLEFVRKNPGKLSYGSTGVGSYQHLMGEYLRSQGIDMLHVPYKGLAPVMTDLASGQIDVAISNLTTTLSLAKDGRVKLLAVARNDRYEGTPDIPSIKEALPNFKFPEPWYGFFGPPGLPAPIVSRLAREINSALASPEIKASLTKMSMVGISTTPEQFSAMVRETSTTYKTISDAAHIQSN